MDADTIEQAIEEELEKLSVNFSDPGSDTDIDIEADATASYEKQENILPDSVLTYFKAFSNRANTFEQLILNDLDDLEIMCNETLSPSQHANDLLSELGSKFDEDPLKLKERIMSEIEAQLELPCGTDVSNGDYDTEYDTHKESERKFMFEWRRLEERLRKEEEQRLAELEAEKEQCLMSAREEEERRRRRSEWFTEELRKTEAINQFEYLKPVEGDGEINIEDGERRLQLELVKQQELIKRLEEQIAEERQIFEQVQQDERRRTEAQCTAAAIKIQAAFRGTLVRRWSKKELTRRREEERKRQEERKEREMQQERETKMKMEWENERRRVQQEEQKAREEAERGRAEYKRAKEQERHRLERECKLEEQRRKEMEEAKKIEVESKIKEANTKRMEASREEEERRKVQEAKDEKKIKEEEKATRIDDEVKRKEESLSKQIEVIRVEEVMTKVQEDEEKKCKEKIKAKRIEDEIKRKDEEESPRRIEVKRVEEVRRKVQEDEEKTRKEKTKKSVDEMNKREEEMQKEMDEMRVYVKGNRKDIKEAMDKRKKKEEQKKEISRVNEEMEKVHVEEEKARKEVEEAKQTEEEIKRNEEEKQKLMEIKRVEEKKKRKEEEEEKRTESEIKRNEKEKKEKGMNEESVVEEFQLKQTKQLHDNEIEQMYKEQRNKHKEKDTEGKEIVIKGSDEQNIEERSRNIIKDNVKGHVDQGENPETDKRSRSTAKCGQVEKSGDNISQLCLSHSVSMSTNFLTMTMSSQNGQEEELSCPLQSTLPILSFNNSNVTMSPPEEKSKIEVRGLQCVLEDSRSECLPDLSEQKRLYWMMNCTPWSKLSIQNKRKEPSAPPRRRAHRRASEHSLLPLPVDTILRSGPWSSLKQVTSVILEDLPGCSLSTLSECSRLQSLTLRRCRLQALDGLNKCIELRYIDLQENNITYVDCGGLIRLEVLLLGRNQLKSIHGLDDAANLNVLQISNNSISCISGLGSLKKLHRLTADHNQLISMRGLSEAFTLLHLDCSYNHLSQVDGLENCALLNTLDLTGNNLTEFPVLKNHVLLRELYLNENNISSLHGLENCWLPLLRCLSVSQNSITQLPLLVDLPSLKRLNLSQNCLSELRNICSNLQGCIHLQEFSITDNPVQQENIWRSSVLAVNPSLIKLNGEQTGASGTHSADSTQLWSFQALCQTHQHQIDSVLERHSLDLSSAPSALHAQLLVGKHAAELFQLAEEQRYAHEYGDSSICETAMQEPIDLAQAKSADAKTEQPAEHKTQNWQAPHLPNFTSKCQSTSGDHNAGYAGSCISPTQNFIDRQENEDRYSRYGIQASRMDLKTVAALLIQRRWREHRQRRCMGHLEPPAKAQARLNPEREVKSCKTRSRAVNKDYAATVIQALWKGYVLRKRLTHALNLVQISEGDEPFEELNMDEFVFDEEAMERDWSTLHSLSSVLPYSEQLPLPKPLRPLPELRTGVSVQPRKPRQAWISDEEALTSDHSQSPDPSTRMRSPASTLGNYSERSQNILEEWGISSSSTAHLMLKRAQRMKVRKQHHQRKLLDPAEYLALFRNHNMQPVAMTIQRSRPEFREQIKAGREDMSVQEALKAEPEQMQTQTHHRTYQWLQTQAVLSHRTSSPSASDHFLPEIDPEIRNGGRVQLVASMGNRETSEAATRQWTDGICFSSPQNHQVYTRTHLAGHAEKEVLSPLKVTLTPSRKERISFRDNPVQMSGGWGGGKKRSITNKLK